MVATACRRQTGRARSILVAALLGSLLAGGTASAARELLAAPTAERHGRCSDRSRWSLAIRPGVEGVWRVRLEIAARRPGQRWTIFVNRNGELFFSGSRMSDGSGDILARVGGDDRRGVDRFRFGAHNVVTGETCRGVIAVDRPT